MEVQRMRENLPQGSERQAILQPVRQPEHEGGVSMIWRWIINGAEIGVTAFCALSFFLALCAVVWGLASLAGHFLKAGSGEHDI